MEKYVEANFRFQDEGIENMFAGNRFQHIKLTKGVTTIPQI